MTAQTPLRAPVRLAALPEAVYPAFRRQVIFRAWKWDPQIGDVNTVADHAAILTPAAATELAAVAEVLARETLALEEALLTRPDLHAELALPRAVRQALCLAGQRPPAGGVPVMRFDFHPTADGWALSEVNRDVPGGFAEASVLPGLAAGRLPGTRPPTGSAPGDAMAEAWQRLLPGGGRLALVHCTAYADDRQVMEFLAQRLRAAGFQALLIAPDHVRWHDRGAACIAEGQVGPLAGIVRFIPVEWLPALPRHCGWSGFFRDALPAANHASAILTQSKRLPLLWDRLGVPVPAWRRLLPPTADPREVPWARNPDWVLKPALGRVGEGILIPEAVPPVEQRRICRHARLFPRQWVVQKRFPSLPLPDRQGQPRHLCVGVFVIAGRAAGFYGRLAARPRIDQDAQDIAVLVEANPEPHTP